LLGTLKPLEQKLAADIHAKLLKMNPVGICTSPNLTRVDTMKKEWFHHYYDKMGFNVEIGPLANPFLKKSQFPNVKYADIRDTKGVLAEYVNGRMSVDESNIVAIDYVCSDSYPGTIGVGTIDAFFSSHVIEHTIDILQHLIEVGECLKEGGVYGMVIPNKNYAHDKFRAVTTIRDAIDVHKYGRKALARLVFDSRLNALHFSKYTMKQTDHKGFYVPLVKNSVGFIDSYDDFILGQAHAWVFTYSSFLEFIRDGIMCELLHYTLESQHSPEEQDEEVDFGIVLRKNSKLLSDYDCRCNEVSRIQRIIDDYNGIPRFKELSGNKPVYIYGAGEIGRNVYQYLSKLS
jgi:predicted SAM-dependent methyltransferase